MVELGEFVSKDGTVGGGEERTKKKKTKTKKNKKKTYPRS